MKDQKYETFAEALQFIAKTYGKETLHDGRRLVEMLHDILQNGRMERSILKNSFDLGIPAKLAAATGKGQDEQRVVMLRCVKLLSDNFGTQQGVAEDCLWVYAEALGWIKRPQAESQATDKEQKKHAELKKRLEELNKKGDGTSSDDLGYVTCYSVEDPNENGGWWKIVDGDCDNL